MLHGKAWEERTPYRMPAPSRTIAFACLWSAACLQPQLLQLALHLAQSVPVVLSTPGAALDPPPLPRALEASAAAPDSSGQHAHLAFLQGVMASVLELVR